MGEDPSGQRVKDLLEVLSVAELREGPRPPNSHAWSELPMAYNPQVLCTRRRSLGKSTVTSVIINAESLNELSNMYPLTLSPNTLTLLQKWQ